MINIQMCKVHVVLIDKFKSQTKLYLLKLPNWTSSPSCISGTAHLTICEISLFVTEGNREGILLATQRVGVAHSEEAEVNQHWISTD